MNFWDKVTGNDMTREFEGFKTRIEKLDMDYQNAWKDINKELFKYSDFTGRNLMPILDGILTMLEETAADGKNIKNVLGNDIQSFCLDAIGEEKVNLHSEKLKNKLNSNIAKKLEK